MSQHPPIEWAQPERQAAFHQWLDAQASAHGVLPATVRAASADASFRRYFRVDTPQGSCIVMDAPPTKKTANPLCASPA
jgi:aminoglycoside/choline kinase family phosphotransferase